MPRFPTRTLVLMLLALVAFVWMWLQTHRATPVADVIPVEVSGPSRPLPAGAHHP